MLRLKPGLQLRPIPDDETTEAWLDAVAEYRRQCEEADQQSLSLPARSD